MTRRIISVVGICTVFSVLTACGASSPTPVGPKPKPTKRVEKGGNYTEIDLGWEKSIVFVKSPDGTLCAVAFNDKAVSTDCNWEEK